MARMHLFVYLLMASTVVFGQVSQVTFGKNRVQFHTQFDDWQQYESENFVTYWYGEGRYIGQAAVMMAEQEYPAIQQLLEYRINGKIELIIYNDLTDVKQSNIGSEDAFTIAGGQTKVAGNKIFVFFDGNHQHLQVQVREGIAAVLFNAMLLGSNLQEMVQNAVQMNLPPWFHQGLLAYVGEDWSTDLDNELRDLVLGGRYKNLVRLAEERPRLAGHALWYFISRNHGTASVANLLYLTRINRSAESGFSYVLGGSTADVMGNCWAFFKQRYEAETATMSHVADTSSLRVPNRRKVPLSQLCISPDGQRVAYAINDLGRVRVYIQDVSTGKRKRVLRSGYRNLFQATDYNYPLLAWSPDNTRLTIMYERRDVIRLRYWDEATNKSTDDVLPNEINRVYSIAHVSPTMLVLSAGSRGASDLWLFGTETRNTSRLTNDFYDDLDAVPFKFGDRSGFLFASNRPSTRLQTERLDSILPNGAFDIFALVSTDTGRMVVQVTATPYANERNPVVIDTAFFAYRSDESGIYNRQMAYLDTVVAMYEKRIFLDNGTWLAMNADSSHAKIDKLTIDSIRISPVFKTVAFSHNNSNFDYGIASLSASVRAQKIAEAIFVKGKWQLLISTSQPLAEIAATNTSMWTTRQLQRNILGRKNTPNTSPAEVVTDTVVRPITPKPVNSGYLFQSDFDDPTPQKGSAPAPQEPLIVETIEAANIPLPSYNNASASPKIANHIFKQQRIIPSRLKFRTDDVSSKIDNSLLFGGLDSYAGIPQNGYGSPPLGLLMKGVVKDLFEDYTIVGGARFATTFDANEFFVTLDNRKHRLDKQLAFYRKSQRFTDNATQPPSRQRSTIFLTQGQLRYPFDVYQRVQATGTVRFDKGITQATDSIALEVPTETQQRIGLKLEYVFDNSREIVPNILNGARAKVFVESMKRFNVSVTSDNREFKFNQGFMTVAGTAPRWAA